MFWCVLTLFKNTSPFTIDKHHDLCAQVDENGPSNIHKILLDGEQTFIYHEQRYDKPNTIKHIVTAVQHACSSMLIKGQPHKPQNYSHSISCTPPHPSLPDVSPIHQSKHMPHYHNGYHLVFLINNEPLLINYLITTSGHPCACSTEHQMLVTDGVSTQPIVSSVTNVTQEGKMST